VGEAVPLAELALQARRQVKALLELSTLKKDLTRRPTAYRQTISYLLDGPTGANPLSAGQLETWGVMLACLFLAPLGELGGEADGAGRSRALVDEWLLGKQLRDALVELGVEAGAAARSLPLLRLLLGQAGWSSEGEPQALADRLLQGWLEDEDARRYLKIHTYEGVAWYNKECFEELVWWSFAAEVIPLFAEETLSQAQLAQRVASAYTTASLLLEAHQKSSYQVERLKIR
jgi:hypothetical protein